MRCYGLENYEGFQIEWASLPISQNLWSIEISTEDPGMWERMLSYKKQHGVFVTPAGPLDQALEAAQKYIDGIWAHVGQRGG